LPSIFIRAKIGNQIMYNKSGFTNSKPNSKDYSSKAVTITIRPAWTLFGPLTIDDPTSYKSESGSIGPSIGSPKTGPLGAVLVISLR
jgi:hypothetical protein